MQQRKSRIFLAMLVIDRGALVLRPPATVTGVKTMEDIMEEPIRKFHALLAECKKSF